MTTEAKKVLDEQELAKIRRVINLRRELHDLLDATKLSEADDLLLAYAAEQVAEARLEQHQYDHRCTNTGTGMWNGWSCAIGDALATALAAQAGKESR